MDEELLQWRGGGDMELIANSPTQTQPTTNSLIEVKTERISGGLISGGMPPEGPSPPRSAFGREKPPRICISSRVRIVS